MRSLKYLTAAIALLFVIGLTETSQAEMSSIFGPVYVAKHATNQDGPRVATFTYASPFLTNGVLVVRNGGDTGYPHRVSSITLKHNGMKIGSEKDFNKNVEEMRYDLDILGDNVLEVEVRSCNTCEVEVTVLADRPCPPTLPRLELLKCLQEHQP